MRNIAGWNKLKLLQNDTTPLNRNYRDTTKTAEPPPSVYTDSLKQSQHGYVLAQSYQSPTTDNNEVTVGTEDSERELYSCMVQATPYRGVKGIISKPTIYVNADEPDLANTTHRRAHKKGILTIAAIIVDKPNETGQIMELIGKQDNVKLTKNKATSSHTEEHGEARLRLRINKSQ